MSTAAHARDLTPARRSGWGVPVQYAQPHNPAFWLYWSLIAIGAYRYSVALAGYHVEPRFLLLAIVLQLLYALPFLLLITRSDRYEREPGGLCLLAFLWGGLVATWVMAAVANAAVLSIYAKLFGVDFATSWGAPLAAPFTEESSKYAGLIILALLARQHVRSAYDGMRLGAFVGLGFQVFENTQYILGAAQAEFGGGQAALRIALIVFAFRAVTGLWSHAMYTAIAGAGLGYFLGATDRPKVVRASVAAGCYLAAMIIHASLDAVLVFGAAVVPFTIFSGTAGLYLAWRFSDDRQRSWMRQLLADEAADGTVTEEELAVLTGTRNARRGYLRAIRTTYGEPAARYASHILDAQIELAAALAATGNSTCPEANRARARIERLRALRSGD